MKFCRSCGSSVLEGRRFCTACGDEFRQREPRACGEESVTSKGSEGAIPAERDLHAGPVRRSSVALPFSLAVVILLLAGIGIVAAGTVLWPVPAEQVPSAMDRPAVIPVENTTPNEVDAISAGESGDRAQTEAESGIESERATLQGDYTQTPNYVIISDASLEPDGWATLKFRRLVPRSSISDEPSICRAIEWDTIVACAAYADPAPQTVSVVPGASIQDSSGVSTVLTQESLAGLVTPAGDALSAANIVELVASSDGFITAAVIVP